MRQYSPLPTEIYTRTRSGFSLIDWMVGLVLIGLVASIAGPRLDWEGYAVRGAANAAGGTLLRAQRRAIQLQHPVVVAFDTVNGRLRIHDDINGNGITDGAEEVSWEPLGTGAKIGRGGAPPIFLSPRAVTFPPLPDGYPGVTFTRNGAAGEEGGFYLTSRKGNGPTTRAVRIQRSTGRLDWYEFDGSTWTTGS